MMYYLWQGVDGSLSGLPVCFIKAVSLLSRFNDKQHASSHILLPATLIIRDYPGNIGVCIYTRCKATTSVCVELVPLGKQRCVFCTPIKLCLCFTEMRTGSQFVIRNPEPCAVGSISGDCDSLLRFIHRGAQYDSLGSRLVLHMSKIFSSFLFSASYVSACLFAQSVQQPVDAVVEQIIISCIMDCFLLLCDFKHLIIPLSTE